MRIKEIELQHVRAIDHLKLDNFADNGVTVISGDNEVGKSTIADALKFLFKFQYTSASQEVTAMHQLGSAEPPQITAHLELDGYDFTVTKVYARSRGKCVIEIHAPMRQTIDGKAAESWLAERFANADTKRVWDVFVAEQGKAQETLSLGGYAQISSALQEAVGQNPETDAQRSIFEHVEKEFKKYFTEKGAARKITPKKVLTDPEKDLGEAKNQLAEGRTKVREYENLLAESRRNEDKLAASAAALPEAEQELQLWQQRNAALEEFRVRVDNSREAFIAAEHNFVLAEKNKSTREALIDELAKAKEAVTAAQAQLDSASAIAEAEENESAAAEAALEASSQNYRRARLVSEIAQVNVGICETLDTIAKLEDKLAQVGELQKKEAELKSALKADHIGAKLSDTVIRKLRTALNTYDTAKAVLEAASPVMTVRAASASKVTVNGDTLALTADGEPHTQAVTEPVELKVGDVTVGIRPGTESGQAQHDLATAADEYESLLEEYSVSSVSEAEEKFASRRQHEGELAQIRLAISTMLSNRSASELEAELADAKEQVQVLQERKDSLQSEQAGEEAAEEKPAKLTLAEAKQHATASLAAQKQSEKAREAAEAKVRSFAARPAKNVLVRAESAYEHTEADSRRCLSALEKAREDSSDAEVFAAVENRLKDKKAAEAQLSDAQAKLAAQNADDVAMSLEGAQSRVNNLKAEHEKLVNRNWQIKIELRSFDSANEKLADYESKVERLQRSYDSLMRNANAARVLYQAMSEARTEKRNELAAPLMEKFMEYGKSVFGPDTKFTMDDDLQIVARANNAGYFATEHLSGGAQEQIDILLRLAAAGIMEGGAGAPVIIDDALGYSDDNRIRLMNNALGRAGKDSQVIVLTCDKRRFDRIPGARFIDINDM